jgi:hypothetical protein
MGDRPKRVRRVDLGDNPIFTEFLEVQGTARGMTGHSERRYTVRARVPISEWLLPYQVPSRPQRAGVVSA